MNNIKITSLLGLVLLLFFCSCNSGKEDIRSLIQISKKEHKLLYVADSRVDCVGEGQFQCMLVKERPEDEWQYFYGSILGFDYEEGYEYLIEVSVKKIDNPPADGSSKEISLVKVWSKEKT